MKSSTKRIAQEALIFWLRPYIERELPKWGTIYRALVGTPRTDTFWQDAGSRKVSNKWFGFETTSDLSNWTDRSTFFLRRWYDLPSQLLIHSAAGRGGVVVDVGANRGDFTLAAAAIVGPQGKVISFEPNPHMAAILRHDIYVNQFANVQVCQAGLADEKTVLSLQVPVVSSGGGTFGLLEIPNDPIANVAVEIGDDVIGDIRPDLIKTDVEGFEVKVIRGLRQTIELSRPVILTEVLEDTLRRCGSTREELFSLMTSLNYRGFGVGTQRTRGRQKLILGDMYSADDVVWVHSSRDPGELCADSGDLAAYAA